MPKTKHLCEASIATVYALQMYLSTQDDSLNKRKLGVTVRCRF